MCQCLFHDKLLNMTAEKKDINLSTLTEVFTKAIENGLTTKEIKKTAKLKGPLKEKNTAKRQKYIRIALLGGIIAVLIGIRLPKEAFQKPTKYMKLMVQDVIYSEDSSCLIVNNEATIEITRKPVDCSICKGISSVRKS